MNEATSQDLPSILFAAQPTGTIKVRGRDGDSIGSIHWMMVNKSSGQITYAVLSLGGFLGLGKSYYPLPFQLLSFDIVDDAYTVTIDRRLLEGGPSWSNNAPDFDQPYADRVSNYYGVTPADLTLR